MKSTDLNRRQALQWTAVAFGTSALAACGSSSNVTPNAPSFVYAMTNVTQNSILTMSRDPVSGILTQGSTTLTNGAGSTTKANAGALGANPLGSQYSLILSPDNSLMFAPNTGDNSVSVFSVNATTGALTLKKNNPLSGTNNANNALFPNSIACNKTNTVVYVTFATGSTATDNHLAAYALGSDGTMTLLNAININPAASPTEVVIDPTGKYLVVNASPAPAPSNLDNLYVVQIASNGSLGAVTSSALPAQFRPFASAFFSSNGVYNYLVTSLTNQAVYALPWNATNGTFSQPSGIAYNYQAGACWSAITPNNSMLIIGNGAGTLSTFALNADGNPSLLNATAISGIGVGGDMWISPDSKFLYVNDLKNAKVLAYSIGSSGSLTAVGTAISIGTYPQGMVGF